jgi:hypothetical protein
MHFPGYVRTTCHMERTEILSALQPKQTLPGKRPKQSYGQNSLHLHHRRLGQWKADHDAYSHYDPKRTMPLVVAQHNEQEFVVESIVGHRGNRTKRSTMEFKVRWADFGKSCDSWEPARPFSMSTSCTTTFEQTR